MIVYDPSNYAQNVLQAARALQQINNQITSLQNQTQMLLNQAKNLASLPYSSLQTIEQSLARTQQLLNEAQRLAYDVNQIDQAFQRLYPQSYTGATSSQQLVSDAKERWQNSLGRLSGCAAGASGCGGEPRHHAHRDRRARLLKPVSRGRPASGSGWQPIGRTADQTARRSDCGHCGAITGAKPRRCSHHSQSGPSARAAQPVSRKRTELSASGRADVPLGEGGRPWIRRSSHGPRPSSCSAAPYLPAPSNWPGKVAPLDPQRPSADDNMDPLANELSRCKALGVEAAHDAACKAVWAQNRSRFLAPSAPYQDRSIQLFPATPDVPGSTQDPSRPSAINAAVRRQHARHGSQGALNHGGHGSHRSLPGGLHLLHRFRLRTARRRGRVSRLDPGRHRHHARRPVLGARIRRGRHRPAHPARPSTSVSSPS